MAVGSPPDYDAFLRAVELTGGSRAAHKLYLALSALDPAAELARRASWLEALARWVCAGPKLPAIAGASNEPPATTRLRLLVRALHSVPEFGQRVRALVASTLADVRPIRLLCETGLPNDRGLWSETSERLYRRLLPSPPDESDLAELVKHMFRSERDADWLAQLPAEVVAALHEQLGDPWEPLRDATHDALALLATRVSALGLSQDIRRRSSPGPVREAPFFRIAHAAHSEFPELIKGCRRELLVVYENLEQYGVSVDVVYGIEVITKCLERIEAILAALEAGVEPEQHAAEAQLLAKLVRARIREDSIADVIRSNLRMLSRKVIERAGETGEHYITVSRKEWLKMLASACGGGVLTVFTCVVRFYTKWGGFAPAVEGLLSAVNYAGSFVAMQLCGFTLATKQPSMTAAALAGSIRETRDAHRLDDLVTTIARICRSQMAAALGNIGAVIPAAVLFELWFRRSRERAFLDPDTAAYTIASFHPFQSGTILFAALTGVLLWCSSLGAGWLENWAVYRRLPEAIAEHRVKRFIGAGIPRWFSRQFSKHVAGFGGSVTLGFLLGMVPAFGLFFGLPLEVRHVTLSTGSLVLAAAALGTDAIMLSGTLWAALGILIIGILNFGVSFTLALAVAFRAREVPLTHSLRLLGKVLVRFFKSPLEFIFPPSWEKELPAHSFRPSHAHEPHGPH